MSNRAVENERLAEKIEKIHMESPDKGYRRLNDDLRHDYGIYVNDKSVLRICRARDMRATVKYNNHGCTRQAKKPQYIAENFLNRQFYSEKPNEKWLTDVTEFKWYKGIEVHKLYLSAILDLCDRRIVSYALSERNDNPLVFKTFDMAVKLNPDAHPLFHSDRGFQYTSRVFHQKIVQAGMVQSMSRFYLQISSNFFWSASNGYRDFLMPEEVSLYHDKWVKKSDILLPAHVKFHLDKICAMMETIVKDLLK